MTSRDGGADLNEGRWDPMTLSLQRLRLIAGEPSYATIAALVAERRAAEGAPPHAARIARSTVYDCFRLGRTRVNLGLVREIATVLGADDAQVERWIAECHDERIGAPEDPGVAEATEAPETPSPTHGSHRGRGLAVLLGCIALNLAGRVFSEFLQLPIHLDMVGTAVAAIALGPWRGAAVGLGTNLLGVASSGLASIPFSAVNVVGALLWGYGVRSWALGRSLPRFFALCVLVATCCSAIAVPILVLAYGGSTGHGQDTISSTVYGYTHVHAAAVAVANLLVSIADKVISGFVAIAAVSAGVGGLRVDPRAIPMAHGHAQARGVNT